MGPLSTPAVTTNSGYEVAQQPREPSLATSLATGNSRMDYTTAVIRFLTCAVGFLALAVLALLALIMYTKPQSCSSGVHTTDPEDVSLPASREDNAGRASEVLVPADSQESNSFNNNSVPITGDRLRELQAQYPGYKGRTYIPVGKMAPRKNKPQPSNVGEAQEKTPLLADDADDEWGASFPDLRSPRYRVHRLGTSKALSANNTAVQPEPQPAANKNSYRAAAPRHKDPAPAM
jgi:hypothetical protein